MIEYYSHLWFDCCLSSEDAARRCGRQKAKILAFLKEIGFITDVDDLDDIEGIDKDKFWKIVCRNLIPTKIGHEYKLSVNSIEVELIYKKTFFKEGKTYINLKIDMHDTNVCNSCSITVYDAVEGSLNAAIISFLDGMIASDPDWQKTNIN